MTEKNAKSEEVLQITELFERINAGMDTPYTFMANIAMHNAKSHPMYQIDIIDHADLFIASWHDEFVAIRFSHPQKDPK